MKIITGTTNLLITNCALLFLAASIFSCNRTSLPILGTRTAVTHEIAGKSITDTLYHTIPAFRMLSQDSTWVTNQTFKNKIYIADFFFTSCPTICPIVQGNLLKVAQTFKDEPNVNFLSYTIDPTHDSAKVLKKYARHLGAPENKWFFVTGNRDSIYHLAEHGYYATAKADSVAPGGFVHSGGLILVDSKQRIRGIYDGTVNDDIEKLSDDLKSLLKEENSKN